MSPQVAHRSIAEINADLDAHLEANETRKQLWAERLAAQDAEDVAAAAAVGNVSQLAPSTGPVFAELQPLPDALLPAPPWDQALLPASLGPWVADVADRMQCPPEYPAIGVLVALSSVIGRRIAIRPKHHDPWAVIPNVWGGIIGPSGLMKTPALTEVMAFPRRLEQAARKEYEEALRAHEATMAVVDAKRKAIKKKIDLAARKSDEAHMKAFETELIKLVDPPAPAEQRYIANDATPEKLQEILRDNPNGVLVFRDELIGLLRGMNREGREGERQLYLEGWSGNGDAYRTDRIGRGATPIEHPCITVLGGIQPGPLGEYLRDAQAGGAGADGLVQRFQLFVYPDIAKEWRDVDRPTNEAAAEAVERIFVGCAKLDATAIGAIEVSRGGVPAIHFAPDAQKVFNAYLGQLEAWIRSGEEVEILCSHLGKFRSLVPALALIFHVADFVAGSEVPGPIGVASVALAIRWAAFLEGHARRIYGMALARGEVAARALSRILLDKDSDKNKRLPVPFTARMVYSSNWAGLTDAKEVGEGLELLADLGWIGQEPVIPSEKGGRPTKRYSPNPGIFRLRPKAITNCAGPSVTETFDGVLL